MKKLAILLAATFACGCLAVGCRTQDKENLKIYMPDGAPALALGLPMYEDNKQDGMEYHVVSAQVIQTYVTGNQPAADVCVLPVNLAAKLLGSQETYRMAGVVTHGNLYFLSADDTQYGRGELSKLLGKTVGVVQLNNVPGLTLKATLAAEGIPYNDLSDGGSAVDNAVNLKAVNPTALVGADVYLLPSPEADRIVENTNLNWVGDLQALYGDGSGYPQAVIVVKNSVILYRKQLLADLLVKIENNTEWLKTAPKNVIADAVAAHLEVGLTPKFTAETLTDGAIAHSGIWMQYLSAETVAEVDGFLGKIAEIDPSKATVPNRNFYWLTR